MVRRLIFVIAAGLALSGCCLGGGCYIALPNNALANWDGLGPLPTRTPPRKYSHVKRVKVRKVDEAAAPATTPEDDSPGEEELAKLKPYSKEWGAVLNAINRAADEKLKKKLIICRDCMPPDQPDQLVMEVISPPDSNKSFDNRFQQSIFFK
jgi:hypothetical protein